MIKVFLLSRLKCFNYVVCVLILFLLTGKISYASPRCDSFPASLFTGVWKTAGLIEVQEGEPGPEGTETRYPDTLIITCEHGRLIAKYVDQFGMHGLFKVVPDNGGNDIFLLFEKLTTKHPESFSIVYHLKIFGDTLQGVALGRTRLFEWRAARITGKK